MNKMHDILEKCLLEIEQGADLDTVLFRYPEYAKELRPMLATAIKAMDMAREPSIAMVQINRAQLLQKAAVLREARTKSSRLWFASMRRLAVTVAVVAALFISGTGFVHASSTTIPGDNLYPVKRTWEDILLLFTFNPQQREQMELNHENERLDELNELFTEGRSVKVDFSGYVTRQTGNEWRVSAVTVLLAPQTILPNQPVTIGAGVRIIGVTQSDKTVLAERIELLPTGSKLPEVKDTESDSQEENHEGQTPQVDDNSGSGSEQETPHIDGTNTPGGSHEPEGTETPGSESESESGWESPTATLQVISTPKATQKVQFEIRDISFDGVLQSFNKKTWTVSGRTFNVSNAEISGTPVIGASVSVEAYYDANGALIAKHVEVRNQSHDGVLVKSTPESDKKD